MNWPVCYGKPLSCYKYAKWFISFLQAIIQTKKRLVFAITMAKLVPATEVEADYSQMTRKDFPKGFVFGTGTAAYQVEGAAAMGGRGISVWDDFSMRTPNRISDGTNGSQAVDMYNKYKDDIKMMKSMGFDVYRFSISWPRIIPSGKICHGVNKEGIDYYNDLINTVRDQGLVPHVTLFHWDLPNPLEKEYGGFLDGEVVDDYRDYVYVCFWEFGDRVQHWTTFNEPWTYCYHGYVSRTMPPGTKNDYRLLDAAGAGAGAGAGASSSTRTFLTKGSIEDSPKPMHDYRMSEYIPPPTLTVAITPVMRTRGLAAMVLPKSATKSLVHAPKIISNPDDEAFIAAKNMIVAHATAVDLYKTKFQGQQGGEIGIVLNNTCFEAFVENDPKDEAAARRVHDFKMGWFLEPALTGKYPETMRPYIPDEAKFGNAEIELLTKNKIDFLGINYYTARYVQDDPNPADDDKPPPYFDQIQKAKIAVDKEDTPIGRDGKPIGDCPGASWVYVTPWGIKNLLQKINKFYNNSTYNVPPLYITENGVAENFDPKKTAAEVVNDTTRVNYYRDHLGNLLELITDWKQSDEPKLEIKGFFVWSWIDNYEWNAGYTNRFGIMYVDYMNNLKRYPKNSAIWFAQFLAGKIPHLLADGPPVQKEA